MNNSYQFDLENLKKARNLDNYRVVYNRVKNNRCLVLFSGNGLYYPNTNSTLQRLIDADRYEWDKIYPKDYEKVIFIRDVYKQWYVRGINNNLDNIEKVSCLLNELTAGYHTVFTGSSAGGYAAVLFGNLCRADLAISLSGQFDLRDEQQKSEVNCILHNAEDYPYLDLSELIHNNVIYFNSRLCKVDDKQKTIARSCSGITTIEVNSPKHGVPFFPFAIKKILNLSHAELVRLGHKTHDPFIFSLRFCHTPDFFTFIKYQILKIIKL